MKKIFWSLGIAALVVASATAQEDEALRVRIASVAPHIGPIAHLGRDNDNGVRLAIEEANAAGLRIGGRPVRFEIVSEDDGANVKQALEVAQRLVALKVAAVIGHLNSGTSVPAAKIYDAAGVPAISGSSTNPRLTELGYKRQFRVVGRDDGQTRAITSFLFAVTRFRSFAIVDDGTAYGEQVANEVHELLARGGAVVALRERGAGGRPDWREAIARIRERQPDAIFFGGMDEAGAPFITAARQEGVKGNFFMADGGCTDQMAKLAPGASSSMLCSQTGIPIDSVSRTFVEAYRARFGEWPLLYAPFTYDATRMVIAAMVKAGSVEPEKYLPHFAATPFIGATGRIAFDEKGDRRGAETTIFILHGSQLVPIAIVQDANVLTMNAFRDWIGGLRPTGFQ
jgi:branched-chain amino acid transport system substrate-binding protein